MPVSPHDAGPTAEGAVLPRLLGAQTRVTPHEPRSARPGKSGASASRPGRRRGAPGQPAPRPVPWRRPRRRGRGRPPGPCQRKLRDRRARARRQRGPGRASLRGGPKAGGRAAARRACRGRAYVPAGEGRRAEPAPSPAAEVPAGSLRAARSEWAAPRSAFRARALPRPAAPSGRALRRGGRGSRRPGDSGVVESRSHTHTSYEFLSTVPPERCFTRTGRRFRLRELIPQ